MRIRILTLVLLPWLCNAAQAQKPSCKDVSVSYEKPNQRLSQNISLSTDARGEYTGSQRVASPQGTRWLVSLNPDYMKPGPWDTTLIIGNNAGGAPILKASFRDHGNTFSANWLNEKLIYIQVWWGRIVSSDMILDVEKQAFIYNEVANYGALTQCQID
jgi:hypothetical protein